MAVDLQEVRAAISESGAAWEAEDTPIAQLMRAAPPGSQSLFGLAIAPEALTALQDKGADTRLLFAAAPPPPARFDWRDHRSANWVSDVRDQQTCGACVAFATCACLESRRRIGADDPHLDIDLSEAHLFFCGCGRCCENGWDFEPALEHCRDHGVGLEAAFPYQPHDQGCPDPEITSEVFVRDWDVEMPPGARRQAIATNGPVIAGMEVYEDFPYYRGGVYRHTTGEYSGLHAVCVVGYDDEGSYWIIKNSWGQGWGEQGFVRLAYGECNLDTKFPFFDPSLA